MIRNLHSMDWRTSHEPIAHEPGAIRSADSQGSLAGVALISLSQHGHGCVRLGSTLAGDLQVARATRGRFGDVAGHGADDRVTE